MECCQLASSASVQSHVGGIAIVECSQLRRAALILPVLTTHRSVVSATAVQTLGNGSFKSTKRVRSYPLAHECRNVGPLGLSIIEGASGGSTTQKMYSFSKSCLISSFHMYTHYLMAVLSKLSSFM